MKKGLLFLSFVLSVLGVSALAGADNANAVSVYDDLLITSPYDKLRMTPKGGDFGNYSEYTVQQFKSHLDNVTRNNQYMSTPIDFILSEEHPYMFFQHENAMTGEYWVEVVFADETSGTNWTETYIGVNMTGPTPTGYNTCSGRIVIREIFTDYVNNQGMNCNSNPNVYINDGNYGWLYHSSEHIDLNYPSGYEGDTPSGNIPPAEYVDYTPNFYASVSVDWKALIHDQNFNTFDSNPFLCSEDLAPVLHYEIWDRSSEPEVMLDSGYNSATMQIEYQFEKSELSKNYRVVGWYDCGEVPEIQFTESSFFDFTINGNGQLHTVGLETCLVDGFPWVDMESCIAGMNSTLALLSFNAVNPTNSGVLGVAKSVDPNNCYELGKLGSWLNKEGTTVCPAFTEDIRNTITPFITFILASTVFFWISRGAGVVIE